jgi:hypothetical protein
MRAAMIAVGLLAISAAAGGGVYMAWGEPETVSMEPASEQGARAERATVYGGRANAAARTDDGGGHGSERAGQSVSPGGVAAGHARSAGESPEATGAAAGAARYEPGEVLVANPPPNLESIVVSQGYRIADVARLHTLGLKVLRLRTPPDVSVPNAVRSLRRQFPQASTDANTLYELSRGEGFPESHARMLIGWPGVPQDCGAGVRLGMIDAAIQPDHPALVGTDIRYRSFHQAGRLPGPANHGTAVAAMMVGKARLGNGWGGLLPGAQLTAANIFQFGANREVTATARGLIEAIDWMAEQVVDVVNMSIAGSNNNVVRQVVEIAGRKGLVLVAAAGNWGPSDRPAYPAAYDDVIAVTAVDADRRIYAFATHGDYIDFAAPGVRVWTAIPGGGQYQSGTSFSSPYVSVLAGLAVSRGHPRDPEAVRQTLRRRVVDLGMPGRDTVFGWGLVDMQPRCVRLARAGAR